MPSLSTRAAWWLAVLTMPLVPQHAHADEPLAACIARLRSELPRHAQVRAESFDRLVAGAQDLRPVIEAATVSQPEFTLPVWDYIAKLVDEQRIEGGRQALAANASALDKIALRHGVDAATAVAVFGVETDYGHVASRYPVIDATLSRACLDLTGAERKRNFFAALWLVQEKRVQPEAFRGSWAGAFGMTQFMPATFVEFAEASDGGNAADIVGNPGDALATTANYLTRLGWVPGLRWGVEVSVPESAGAFAAAERDHACLVASVSPGRCKTVAQWAALGLTTDGSGKSIGARGVIAGLPANARAALLMPAGVSGPAWLVSANYQALWKYNRADAYALAIGLLSDALRGRPGMQTPWPTDDLGLSRAQLQTLQLELIRRGHGDVTADGADGPRTRAAITVEEQRLGWVPTGHAGARIVRALGDAQPKAK